MSRSAKRKGKTVAVVEEIDLRTADVESLLVGHTLGPDAAAAIAGWSPMRRGTSAHHSGGSGSDGEAVRAAAGGVSMLPQHGRNVLVVLRDGRQIEGDLHTMTGRYEVGGIVFAPWEIESIENIT